MVTTGAAFPALLGLLSIFYKARSALGALVNVTVDDSLGDPITKAFPNYLPTDFGSWAAFNSNNDTVCSDPTSSQSCWSRPQPASSALNSTFHLTSWNPHDDVQDTPSNRPRVEIQFYGNAVYAYGIMYNKGDLSVAQKGITSASYLSFMIDNVFVGGEYIHTPDNTGGWVFNVPVYVNTSITSYGQHKLTIMNGGGPTHSFFIFDYVIYTYDTAQGAPTPSSPTSPTTSPSSPSATDPSNPFPSGSSGGNSPSTPSDPSGSSPTGDLGESSHKSSAGPIVGGVLGTLGALGLIGFGLLFYRRRENKFVDQWYLWSTEYHTARPAGPAATPPAPQMTQRNLESGARSTPPPPEYPFQQHTHAHVVPEPAVHRNERRTSIIPNFLRNANLGKVTIFSRLNAARRNTIPTPFQVVSPQAHSGEPKPYTTTSSSSQPTNPGPSLSFSPPSKSTNDSTGYGYSPHSPHSPNSPNSPDSPYTAQSSSQARTFDIERERQIERTQQLLTRPRTPSPPARPSQDTGFDPTRPPASPSRSVRTTGSGRSNSPTGRSVNARLEAQVHALARQISYLREQGTLVTARRGSFLSDLNDLAPGDLPPMYKHHEEDDLMSH